MKDSIKKKDARIRRAMCTRKKIHKMNSIRLVVHRTSKHIYAQITILRGSRTIVSASTLEKDISNKIKSTSNKVAAEIVGEYIAKRAIKNNIRTVSFDRSGFKYHGRVYSLANSARKHGLKF